MEMGLFLIRFCAMIWSLFVLSWAAEGVETQFISPVTVSAIDVEKTYTWYFSFNTCLDVLSKLLFNSIIVDAYTKLFDVHRAVLVAKVFV